MAKDTSLYVQKKIPTYQEYAQRRAAGETHDQILQQTIQEREAYHQSLPYAYLQGDDWSSYVQQRQARQQRREEVAGQINSYFSVHGPGTSGSSPFARFTPGAQAAARNPAGASGMMDYQELDKRAKIAQADKRRQQQDKAKRDYEAAVAAYNQAIDRTTAATNEPMDEVWQGRMERAQAEEDAAKERVDAAKKALDAVSDKTYSKVVDRLLGVDSSKITGEKTNWWDVVKGSAVKGANQWNAANWKTIKFLFGDAAEELHTLGTETVNQIIGGLNKIPGVDIDYLGKSRNLIDVAYDDAQAGLKAAQEKYDANANSSRAAQIVDNLGTGFVAAVPMAVEALLLSPAQAAQAGAAAASPAGLSYFSGLQSASGMKAAGMMARQGMEKLFQNPQFWSSYLQVAGDGYEDALADGMSNTDASIYGLINGFFNATIEIGGADETLGGIQNLPMRMAQLEQQGGKKAVVEWFKDSVLGEGLEEVQQGIFERGMKSFSGQNVPVASLDPADTRAIFNPWTSAQEFTGGAVVGGLLGGGQIATQNLVQQVFAERGITLTEQQQEAIMATRDEGSAGTADFAVGTREAYEMGENGATMEETVEQVGEKYGLTPKQARTAWGFGASELDREVNTDKAYEMGKSGVSKSYLTGTEEETAAYERGRAEAFSTAAARAEKIQGRKNEGNLARVKGIVKGEGVSMEDLRKTFNDRQNTAYRLLTKYAETTGVNIVLYKSQADKDGNFPDTQGRFQWKDDTIYIDINSGLNGVKDVDNLGKYTMMRVFAHEFTHFIEKWNPVEYNNFREYVFKALEDSGQNVNDLIEAKQALDASGKMSYEQASREAVADGMMDVLSDSTLVQQLAQENQTVFRKLLDKLRDFAARLKQHYREFSGDASAEAKALKANSDYLDGIVKMWDEIAKGAVENYQSAKGEAVLDQPGKPANLPKRSKANVHESAKDARSEQTETRRAGMDFFRGVEEGTEAAQDIRQQAGVRRLQPVNRDRFPANDLTSEAETGEDVRQQPGVTRLQPVGRERFAPNDLTSREETGERLLDRVPKKAESAAEDNNVPGKEDTPEGAKLRAMLEAGDAEVNGLSYEIFGMGSTTIDVRDNRVSSGREYRASIRRVDSSSGVPIYDARYMYRETFPTRAEAVDALVAVAEYNHFLEERKEKTNESTNNTDTADVRAETGNRRNGAGAVRVSDEREAGTVQRDVAEKDAGSVPPQDGDGAGRHGNRPDAKRDGRSRSKRSGKSGVQPGRESHVTQSPIDQSAEAREAAAPMSETEQARQTEELHDTTEEQVERQSTEAAGGNNYVIGDSLDLPSGSKARYRANVDAIRIVKQLEAENRNATPEEQAALARYVGWGGIPEAFDERKADWSKEYAELKELLTDEEYKAARASTTNAHYTSIEVIRAMYEGLRKLGFKGGRMLEPSSGVGNFVGAMPADMTAKVKSWTMVELDSITGLIAKHLYPQSDVRIEGFEKAIIPDNFMDVAIGNVPFGNYPVVDRGFPKKLTSAIHNYFFAKSLNKVRPGGIVMFITSSYTMNSNDQTVRRYIAKQADLLGAIRLPNTAFKGNAGTEVVTDILILKKRAPGTEYAGQAFIDAPWDYSSNRLGYRNEYFVAHPEMIMGEEATTGSMYRRNEYTVNPKTDAGTLGEQITKAFENITGQMDYPAQESPEKTNIKVQRAEKGTKQGGYVQKDGKIYQNDGGALKEVQTDAKTAKRIAGMLGIRDAARALMNAQQQGMDEKSVKDLRKTLNKAYDGFVKEYGFLNAPANKKAFADDPDRFSLYALENWDAEKKTATKADIFTVDTIRPNQTITHADTVKDAVVICRNTIGSIDVQVISDLTGKSQEAVTRELIDSELAFKNRDGQLEPAETYLSGNVRAKLRDAQGLVGIDKDYQHNIDALTAIVPANIPHEQIFVQPGTPWIPGSVYSDFAAYMLGGNNHRAWGEPDVQIRRSNQTGTFTIDLNSKRLKNSYQNTQEWGTPKRSFLNLLDAMMNSRSVTVTYKDAEGHTYVDRVATDAANEKIEQITKKFQEWLWADEERTKDLEYLYNESFNNLVTPKYDGSSLSVNGLRAGWSLRPHQADAVQRIVSSGGNTLLAHRVGAGKTLEMAAAAMKLKELGIVQKPMFAVPKSLVAQWGKEFSSYFPAAKLLVAEQSDFTTANRKTFANRIATGNYDAIIVSYEQFEKIPVSDSFALRLYQEQVDEIIQAINEAKEESGEKSMSVKDMEKKRKQLEAKIEKLSDKAKDTDSIEFEQLGIDSIFIDEAHNFKNLFYTTSMNNVSGLGNKDGSKRAFDLYTKVRYLQQLNGGRGVVFATATPVMNSMSEMYIMQKYLQSDLLDQLGLSTFDAWAKQFGEVVNGVEIKPSGQGYRVKQSFSRFKNMNELQLLFRNFSDVLTKVPGLKIPKMKGGAVKVVECEAGEFQQDYMKKLEVRADNVKNVDPSVDNMLKITSDGRKISYTQRMIDPSLPYEEGCKLYKCAENIVTEYKASNDIKGTQIVFCDMATPKGKSSSEKAGTEEDTGMDAESARLYDDLKRRLVKLGIPAKEIAFIHDADTDAKKSKLFDDVNAGRVRVLIGSTGKMGVGMNAQKRAVAIHHLDAPWRPGDVEQRDGRVFRQGNINEEVSKYVYVTKGSFDARLWDIIDRKSSFIDQIMNGENVGRDVEDTGEVTLSAAEVKALASGSPLILEQVQLETDIKKLQNLYMAHRQSVIEAGKKLQEAKQEKAEAETSAANARKDIQRRTDASKDDTFSMKVGNKTFTDKKEAGKALMAQAAAKAGEAYTKIGSFAGFDVFVMQTKEGIIGLLKADGGYRFHLYPDNTTLMITNMQKTLNGLDGFAQKQEEIAAQKAQEITAQEAMMQAPFPKQAELDEKRQRYNEVMEILNPKEEQALDADDGVEESTRRQTVSDREVLQMAASEITVDGLSDGEKDALRIFNETLGKLQEAQEKREELGRQYKEQQFTKGGSRTEAAQTLNRMNLMDTKIKALENRVLSLENKDVLKRVLQKARAVVEAQEKVRGKQVLQQYREKLKENAATRKYRDRVRAQVLEFSKFMTSPSNKDVLKHVPAEIQKSMVDFLGCINLSSKTALRTDGAKTTKADEQYLKAMKKLREAIKQNVDSRGLYSGYADLPPNFMDDFDAMIQTAEEIIEQHKGEFVINQMSAAKLKELSDVLKVLKKHVQEMNRFHNNAMFQHVDEAGENTIDNLSTFERSKRNGFIYKFARFDYMRPSLAFEHFGEGGKSIEHEFREGQAEQAFLANKIIGFAKETFKGKEVDAWSKDIKTFTLSGGEEISLPAAAIMSIYCLNKRPQAQTHLYGDGIRVANYKADGKVQLDEGHLLTVDDIQKMVQALTPRQIEVADALQKFMSKDCAEWGNYVSMRRFGVEQFGEANYFPINSDGRYLPATADESPTNAALYALLNMGFTKELKENAKNRIIIYNIFDVFANHTASMAQYRAFALPVLDALRWFNYKNDATSVRDKLSMAFGAPEETRAGSGSKGYAESFVINLLRAYNGTAPQGDPYDSLDLKMLHRFNGAQIAYNLRVVIQQPTAIVRAATILSPAKLTKGLGMSIAQMRKLADEMEAHSGIAAWKRLGFYDTNISRGLTELIKQTPTVLDRVMDVGTWGAEQADRLTWAAMWYAAKESVNRSRYDSEEAYFKAVTELFEDVIYKTQVVDSILTKAEFLRARGGVARQLGSFMSEPSATMSMLSNAYFKYTDDMQRGMTRSAAWQKNSKNIMRAFGVYAVGQITLAAMQAVVDAWRDDDEYDAQNWLSNFLQKWLNAFKGNAIEELLPFGKIPVVSEIYETVKGILDYAGIFEKLGLDLYGNDISSGLSMYLKYVDKTAKIIIDYTGDIGYTKYGIIYNLMRGASNMSGLPAATITREAVDLWNNTVGFFAPSKKLVTYQRKRDKDYETIRDTGISKKAYEKALDDSDADHNGSIKQDELGEYLVEAISRGEITEEQADAVWKTKWNSAGSKTFDKWRSGKK